MKLLNLPYYKQLIKQYYKIPLAITLLAYGLAICSSVTLGLGEGVLALLGPVAMVLMVVMLSIRMFEHLHHSLDVSHLLSMPLTRSQIYVTNVLAGLTLLVVPCTCISLGISFEIRYWLSFIFLLIYYFVLCCFSSIVCRKTLTNILFMLFLTAGLAIIVVLNQVVVNMYVFGGSFDFDFNYLNIFMPIIGAMNFAIGKEWTYFPFHLLFLIILIALSFYQVKHLKIEEAENKRVVVMVIKPFVYAIIFLLLLGLFQVSFKGYHYDDTYYLRLFLVMGVLSIISALLCQMWLTSSLHEIFTKCHFLQSVIYIALSFVLFLVPFRFQPQYIPIYIELGTVPYYSVLYVDEGVIPLYNYIQSHPENFKKDEGEIKLWVSFENSRKCFYFDEKDMDKSFKQTTYEMIKANRVHEIEPMLQIQNNFYQVEDYLAFIKQIEAKTLPKDYFKHLKTYEYNDDYYSYAYALTDLSFEEFMIRLKKEVKPYLDQEALNAMYNQVEMKMHDYDVTIENIYCGDVELGKAEICVDVTSNAFQTAGDMELNEDYYYTFIYQVILNEDKEIQEIKLEEVY